MACPYREGETKCTWMLASGCINPRVNTDVKKQRCDGKLPLFKTEGIKQEGVGKWAKLFYPIKKSKKSVRPDG